MMNLNEAIDAHNRMMRAVNGIPKGCGVYPPCEKVITPPIHRQLEPLEIFREIDSSIPCRCKEREQALLSAERTLNSQQSEYWRCDCCGGTSKSTDEICSWCRSGKVVTPSKKNESEIVSGYKKLKLEIEKRHLEIKYQAERQRTKTDEMIRQNEIAHAKRLVERWGDAERMFNENLKLHELTCSNVTKSTGLLHCVGVEDKKTWRNPIKLIKVRKQKEKLK